MHIKGLTPILNVSNVPASVEWFEALGWCRGFTWNDSGMIAGKELHNEHGPARFAGLCACLSEADHAPMLFLCQDGQGARDPRPCTDPKSDSFGAVWMS